MALRLLCSRFVVSGCASLSGLVCCGDGGGGCLCGVLSVYVHNMRVYRFYYLMLTARVSRFVACNSVTRRDIAGSQ